MAAACLNSFFRFGREAEHSNFEKYCQKLKRSLAIVLHSCAFWGRYGGGGGGGGGPLYLFLGF